MFERPHHRRIVALLARMDAGFLKSASCYFGGGTAIALQLGEFRESIDIDFLCADQEGYRLLRSSVFDQGLGKLFPGGVDLLREVRADRDGIRAIVTAEGTPVKFEIVREARIALAGTDVAGIPVPCLTPTDLFAEKLLANADRWGDKSAMSRDIIDLMVMQQHWGDIPAPAWEKARGAYGDAVSAAYAKALDMLQADSAYLAACLTRMGVNAATAEYLRHILAH